MQLDVIKRHHLTGHAGAVYKVLAEHDALYSAGGDGWLVRWSFDDIETGRVVARANVQIFTLAATDKWFIAGDMNGGVHWLSRHQPDAHKHVAAHAKGCYNALTVAEYVFTVGAEGRLIKWSALSGQRIETAQISLAGLRGLAKCPTKPDLAIGSRDRTVYFLDPDSMLVNGRLHEVHKSTVFSLAYHPLANFMYSGGKDAMLHVYEFDKMAYTCLWSQPAHLFTINDIQISPNGRLIATASRDKTIKLWDARNMKLLKVIDLIRAGGHRNSVNTLCWLSNSRLATGSDDKTIILWDIITTDQSGESLNND